MSAARRCALWLASCLATACATTVSVPDSCDVLIIGGAVVDGTGAPPRRADVVVVGDRIAAVVELSDAQRAGIEARRTVDATGMVVTPGFIDVHAHGDPLRTPEFANFVAMGVTTVCLGLDGVSPGRGDVGEWLAQVERRRPGPNLAAFVGHGSVRREAGVGASITPGVDELGSMAELVGRAMDAGAFGLSTGLEYIPGRFATMDELVAIAGPVGARGGLVASHVRSEDDSAIEDSVRELLTQCRRSGAAAHLSHAKIVYAKDPARAEAVLALLAEARAAGVRATADVYPYVASFTGISIVFPEWALEPHDYAEVVRTRRAELAEHLRNRVNARNGPEATLFGTGRWAGRTLADAAAEQGVPFEDLLVELGPGGASAAYFVMASAVMERFLTDPHVMVASDGSPTMRHPRGHGTFARVIREHVVERGLLTLEEAVHKMSGLPAETLGLPDRGRIAPGLIADLLVFDPAAVRDRATFVEPFRKAEGFTHVLVGGVFVVDGGVATGARPGRALRRESR